MDSNSQTYAEATKQLGSRLLTVVFYFPIWAMEVAQIAIEAKDQGLNPVESKHFSSLFYHKNKLQLILTNTPSS